MRVSRRTFRQLAGWYLLVFFLTTLVILLAVRAIVGSEAQWTVWSPLAVAGAGGLAALIAAKKGLNRFENRFHIIRDVVKAAGEGDFSGRVSSTSDPIVSELADTVNRMLAELASRFASMQTEQSQLRTVLDSMVEGVIALDASQHVLLINTAACELLKVQANSVGGRLLGELVRNPQLEACVNRALSQEEPVVGEMGLLGSQPRFLSLGAVGLPGEPCPGVVVVLHNVTELRRLERVRQEFVANASHELKTPLAAISACVETLVEGAVDDPEHRMGFLHAIGEHAGRLDAMVQDLLALARAESREAVRETRPLVLNEVAAACLEKCRQGAERKHLSLSIEASEEPVLVMAEEGALEEILENLLDNAIKYTSEHGSVRVRVGTEESYGVVEVHDTGIGIPQSHLNRIFERFYRVDRARSREVGGTGLGLAIVKHLVQELGGQVTAESELGKGSTFVVRIALVE